MTIAAGSASALVTIAPVDDSVSEGFETVIMNLTTGCCCGGGGYTLGSPSSATVTIEDNDVANVVTITANDPTATEQGPTTGQFTVTRTGSTANSRNVYYNLTGSSATYSSDYSGVPNWNGYSGFVTIAAGSASALVTITPVDDSATESSEAVIMNLTTGCCCGGGGYTLGSPSSATVTIEDNDVANVVTITANDPTATEQGPTIGQFTVTRTGSTANSRNVYYNLTGSSATYSSDYSGVPNWNGYSGYVTIAAGSASALVTITPVDDSASESSETVVMNLTTGCCCGGGGYTLGSPSGATVTIEDNDGAPR